MSGNHSISRVESGASFAAYFDHTLLKPDSTREQIIVTCAEAKQYQFATVCVNPYWVKTAANELAQTNVGVTTVVGFPLGATSTVSKVMEARDAIASGATEIDMVMNIGALKSGMLAEVERDIASVVSACGTENMVKVIIETGLLTDEEKVIACQVAVRAGARFVKTSTGFGPGGATVEDIQLMRRTVGPDIGVKASGGVRNREVAQALIAAGATRIGASASVAIVQGSGTIGGGY
jgi:deoxyribose-phosphate aldolase